MKSLLARTRYSTADLNVHPRDGLAVTHVRRRSVTIAVASVFLALEPIAGVGLSALILQEPSNTYLLAGLVLVVAAMQIARWPATAGVRKKPAA